MRTTLVAILIALVTAVYPLRGQDLKVITPFIPSDADYLVALQWSPGSLANLLATISIVPGAANKVITEQCAAFCADTGLNPLDITMVAIAGHAQSKTPPLALAQTKADAKKLAAALKTGGPFATAKIDEDAAGFTASRGDLTLRFQAPGVLIVGSPDLVKQALASANAHAGHESDLVSTVIKNGGDKSTLSMVLKLPSGITSPMPPPLAAQLPAPLMARMRGIYAGARDDNYEMKFTFDTADAAGAAQPVLAGALKSAEGVIEQQATVVIAQAKSGGPFWALQPQVLGVRSWLETYRTIEGALRLTASGADLLVALPKSTIGLSLPPALVVGIIAAIAVPNFVAARNHANQRACFANQKTIAGALEMYKLDKNKTPGALSPELLGELAKEGYLQQVPDDPGAGPGTANHYYSVEGGNGVACTVHGSVDGSVKPLAH